MERKELSELLLRARRTTGRFEERQQLHRNEEAPQDDCDEGQAEAFRQTLPLRSLGRENNLREGDRRRHRNSQRLSGQDLNPLEQAPSRDRTPRRRSREIIRGAKNPRHKGKRPGEVERVCGGNNRTG